MKKVTSIAFLVIKIENTLIKVSLDFESWFTDVSIENKNWYHRQQIT